MAPASQFFCFTSQELDLKPVMRFGVFKKNEHTTGDRKDLCWRIAHEGRPETSRRGRVTIIRNYSTIVSTCSSTGHPGSVEGSALSASPRNFRDPSYGPQRARHQSVSKCGTRSLRILRRRQQRIGWKEGRWR